MTMNYQECVQALANAPVQHILQDGLDICVKPIPDDDRLGVPDSRMLKMLKARKPGFMPKDPQHLSQADVEGVRRGMGCENTDLSKHVKTEQQVMQTPFGAVSLYIYTPETPSTGKRPCILYFHGGAFLGGTVQVVQNACRLQAECTDAVVIAPDYGLCPEFPFPQGLMQCYQSILWAKEHAEQLGIDPARLVVMGDSAGACLATACCLLDDEQMIAMQVLLYPCLLNADEPDGWTEAAYDIREEGALLYPLIHETGDGKAWIQATYCVDTEQLQDPLCSPYLAKSFRGMPPTLIVTPEYDYLRLEGEGYARKLQEDGVDVVLLRYNGINHSFYERTGEFPQAEDVTMEVARAIRAL